MSKQVLEQAGYVFNFAGHGAYSPDGKIEPLVSETEITEHNRSIAAIELENMRQAGCAVLYYRTIGGRVHVGTWDGSFNWPVTCVREGRHNMAGTRTDCWFTFEGQKWHGVNIGDNELVRCKRNKAA
jgi:hypothetical protein